MVIVPCYCLCKQASRIDKIQPGWKSGFTAVGFVKEHERDGDGVDLVHSNLLASLYGWDHPSIAISH